jgi:cystathionine gamma-lyase
MQDDLNLCLATRVIHGGQEVDKTTGAVIPPIYATSTYKQAKPGVHQGYEYSRTHNPTRSAYEKCIANLESGEAAFAFSSGMAAVNTVMALFKPGDHIIAMDDLYGGSYRLFTEVASKSHGLYFDFVDLSDTENLENLIREKLQNNTKLIWIESPTNPLLKLVDLAKISAIAKKYEVLTLVDNTFASPMIQRPLEYGIDLVLHSATKYINGHSDIVGGVVVATKDPAKSYLTDRLQYLSNAMGAIQGPFDSFLALRGLKTLAIRMQAHCQNGLEIAQYLEQKYLKDAKLISKIYYPGLKSHPQHQLAQEQMSFGFGGIISFELAGGYLAVEKFLSKLQIITLAESLGGVESLINYPVVMTHAAIPKSIRDKLGVTEGVLRLSVGIEDVNDLKNELDIAFSNLK